MIEYKVCGVSLYYDDILQYLRAYNNQFTEHASPSKTVFVYIYEEESLVGAIKTVSTWDWATIKALFYKDITVLKHLIHTVWRLYDNISGIKFFSPDSKRHQDMLSVGFIVGGK
ncbi:MAG: hypothetical protein UMR38_08325 [Candidatus Izemoplasma sp.]|nr:hypothetical protein [Candidatus Izemoplasma sp.]